MDGKLKCAECVAKPGFFSGVRDAVPQVDGTLMCQEHAREALRRKRER